MDLLHAIQSNLLPLLILFFSLGVIAAHFSRVTDWFFPRRIQFCPEVINFKGTTSSTKELETNAFVWGSNFISTTAAARRRDLVCPYHR
jgi:hypothetical protein